MRPPCVRSLLVARVVVVGSANVDLVWHGPRLPQPGETVSNGEYRRVFGGKGANQASAAAQLGAAAAFVGMVGDDEFGRIVRADLNGQRCRLFVARRSNTTGVALILVAADGENMVAVAPGTNRALPGAHVEAAVRPALAHAGDAVLVGLEIGVSAARIALTAGR